MQAFTKDNSGYRGDAETNRQYSQIAENGRKKNKWNVNEKKLTWDGEKEKATYNKIGRDTRVKNKCDGIEHFRGQ